METVRRVSCRAWLAAQTYLARAITGVNARRNPPKMIGFDVVDYDAR